MWGPGRAPGPAHAYGRPTPTGPATENLRIGDDPAAGFPAESRARGRLASASATGGMPRVSGVLDRFSDQTGPLAEPAWWSYGSSDHPAHPLSARHSSENRPGSWGARPSGDLPGDTPRENYHPSGPLPPLPPGVWDRLRPRESAPGARGAWSGDDFDEDYDEDYDEDSATVAQPRLSGPPADVPPGAGPHGRRDRVGARDENDSARDDSATDAHRPDPQAWEDPTGGLEVVGAHVDGDGSRRRWRRRDRDADQHEVHPDPDPHGDAHVDALPAVPAGRHDVDPELHGFDDHDRFDDHDDHGVFDDDVPVDPYDRRSGRRGRRRRPFAVLLSLLVLAGLVVGIVVGGEKLWTMINPSSADFTGQGTGSVDVRINQGDTLSDIARTLVDDGVIASVGPFIDAAEADPASTGIQPGVYRMRAEMSGQAAVDMLLDPATRLVTRVTLPEGLTVKATLAKLAETSGTPLAELEAAAADPAALGLPAYAGGKLEGFLFPATYDFEPGTTPVQMLSKMVDRAVRAFDELQIPEADRLTVLTKASLVQAEASTSEDMAKVARVLENRLADGMPLQLDTTVNYANGKSGITTTAADRANPSPYNTYVHAGLPPGAINNPGEEALRAVLSPADGEWRFFVVVDPDTGDTRFAVTGEEHQQNVLLFQQWLREQPGG